MLKRNLAAAATRCAVVRPCLFLAVLAAQGQVCYQFSDAKAGQAATHNATISIASIPASLMGAPSLGGGAAYSADFTSYQALAGTANYSPSNVVTVISGQTTYTYNYFSVAIYNDSSGNTLSFAVKANVNLNNPGQPPSTLNLSLGPLGAGGNLFPNGLTPNFPPASAWTGGATGVVSPFGMVAAGGFSGSPFNVTSIGASCAPGTTAPSPAITPGGVVTASAFGEFPSVSPGAWIEIYGSGLAADTQSWTSADFTGNIAPTMLGGTTVIALLRVAPSRGAPHPETPLGPDGALLFKPYP
jgi:hypothetical protein